MASIINMKQHLIIHIILIILLNNQCIQSFEQASNDSSKLAVDNEIQLKSVVLGTHHGGNHQQHNTPNKSIDNISLPSVKIHLNVSSIGIDSDKSEQIQRVIDSSLYSGKRLMLTDRLYKLNVYLDPICEQIDTLTSKQLTRVALQFRQFINHTNGKLGKCIDDQYNHDPSEYPITRDQLKQICLSKETNRFKLFESCAIKNWNILIDLELDRIIDNRIKCGLTKQQNNTTTTSTIKQLRDDERLLIDDIVNHMHHRNKNEVYSLLSPEVDSSNTTNHVESPATIELQGDEITKIDVALNRTTKMPDIQIVNLTKTTDTTQTTLDENNSSVSMIMSTTRPPLESITTTTTTTTTVPYLLQLDNDTFVSNKSITPFVEVKKYESIVNETIGILEQSDNIAKVVGNSIQSTDEVDATTTKSPQISDGIATIEIPIIANNTDGSVEFDQSKQATSDSQELLNQTINQSNDTTTNTNKLIEKDSKVLIELEGLPTKPVNDYLELIEKKQIDNTNKIELNQHLKGPTITTDPVTHQTKAHLEVSLVSQNPLSIKSNNDSSPTEGNTTLFNQKLQNNSSDNYQHQLHNRRIVMKVKIDPDKLSRGELPTKELQKSLLANGVDGKTVESIIENITPAKLNHSSIDNKLTANQTTVDLQSNLITNQTMHTTSSPMIDKIEVSTLAPPDIVNLFNKSSTKPNHFEEHKMPHQYAEAPLHNRPILHIGTPNHITQYRELKIPVKITSAANEIAPKTSTKTINRSTELRKNLQVSSETIPLFYQPRQPVLPTSFDSMHHPIPPMVDNQFHFDNIHQNYPMVPHPPHPPHAHENHPPPPPVPPRPVQHPLLQTPPHHSPQQHRHVPPPPPHPPVPLEHHLSLSQHHLPPPPARHPQNFPHLAYPPPHPPPPPPPVPLAHHRPLSQHHPPPPPPPPISHNPMHFESLPHQYGFPYDQNMNTYLDNHQPQINYMPPPEFIREPHHEAKRAEVAQKSNKNALANQLHDMEHNRQMMIDPLGHIAKHRQAEISKKTKIIRSHRS